MTFVHLYQEAAGPGPVAVLPGALPEDTEDLLAQGLHLKTERAHCVLAQEEQLLECRSALGWRMRTWLRVTQVISILIEENGHQDNSPHSPTSIGISQNIKQGHLSLWQPEFYKMSLVL